MNQLDETTKLLLTVTVMPKQSFTNMVVIQTTLQNVLVGNTVNQITRYQMILSLLEVMVS